jgi:hypothetical protein
MYTSESQRLQSCDKASLLKLKYTTSAMHVLKSDVNFKEKFEICDMNLLSKFMQNH